MLKPGGSASRSIIFMVVMVDKVLSTEEINKRSDEREARAQEYKKSKQYLDAVAAKRKKRGQKAMPTPMTGDVYGSRDQISARLQKQYASGDIPADVSAEIVENKDRPGQYSVYFSETAGYKSLQKPSTIKYYDYKDVQQPVSSPAGRYSYDVAVDQAEQARDVRIWAAAHGHTSERIRNADDRTAQELNQLTADQRREAGQITVRVHTDELLPEGTSIDIRSSETLERERSEKLGRVMGEKIYEKADPVEKVVLHVRTLLSPAGYGYVGAMAKEQGGPVEKALIDLAFPGVKSTEDIVKSDISKRTARHSRGVYTYNIAGFDVDERIVSAINNPVTDVALMGLGGAGAAKVATTKIGAKLVTSIPGKLVAAGMTGLYVGERSGKVLKLREEGKGSEALGTAITAVAGLGAAAGAYKTEYSHIIKARAQNIVKVDIKQVKGGSVTKSVGKDTAVSRGKFQITEGKLKGLKGDTVSLTGKKGGFQVTKIPKQTVGSGKGKIKIQEQVFRDFTEHGIVSKKLKISWRKAGDMLLQIKSQDKAVSKVIGPRRDASLMQEVSRSSGKIKISKQIPGGKATVEKSAVVRKFSGISTGHTARKYDLVLVQKGDKIIIAEQSVIASKHLSKIDWVDVSLAKSGGAGSGTGSGSSGLKVVRGSGGTATAVKTVSSIPTAKTPPPPTPSTMNIKIQTAGPTATAGLQARIIPNVNPVPAPVRIKRSPEPKELSVDVGVPQIVRTTDLQQERDRTVLGRVPVVSTVPAIMRPDTSGKLKEITIIGTGQIAIPVTHPVTGRDVTAKERTAVLAELEPIIDRVPSQPVVPVETHIKPPHIIPNLGMIPFLRMGRGKFNIDKMLKGIKTNPVPEIERVI